MKLSPKISPITYEVLRHAFFAIIEEMSAALKRSAYSTNIKTRADFSCAFFDKDCRLVVQAFAQPIHLATMVHLVPNTIREYGPENIGPDDGILVNDVHRVGGTHLNDISLVSPVYYGGEVVGYVGNIAHHIDVGGGVPGSLPVSTSIYQDGLIIPPVKLVRGGEVQRDVMELVMANVRGKKENAGDFRAQIAANRLGAKRFAELYKRYGKEVVENFIDELFNHTEKRAREQIRSLPKGDYEEEGYADDDGVEDRPIRIKVKVSIKDDKVVFDFTGTDAQRKGPMNAHYGVARGIGAYVLKCIMGEDVAINHGLYRCFEVIVPRKTVLNAEYPASLVGMAEVGTRALEITFRALAKALPDKIPAQGKTCICNLSFGGVNPKTGEEYVFYETIAGGYGARPNKDGMEAVQAHWQNTENSPVEELEASLPVIILRYELIPDSEGAGKYRGGLGVRRDYWFKDHAATFSALTDVAKYPPLGLFGGLPARPLRIIRNPKDGDDTHIGSKVTVSLEPNEVISVQTPGGGGYGNPLERDPLLVLSDVIQGKVSLKRAREVYGVVINPETMEIDWKETESLRRSRMRVG